MEPMLGAVAVALNGRSVKLPSDFVLTVLPSFTNSTFTRESGLPTLSRTTPVIAKAEPAKASIPRTSNNFLRSISIP